jgi:YggT family protein
MSQALLFLFNAVCSFFSTLFLLRLFMQWRQVSFASPAGGFVLVLTNWAVLPLRRVIPGFLGVDWASLMAALLLNLVYAAAFLLLAPVLGVELADWTWLALSMGVFALKNLITLFLYLLIILLIVQAVLSWVSPWSSLQRPLAQLTAPLLIPVQRLIPPISGIDLSPLVVILILQTLLIIMN